MAPGAGGAIRDPRTLANHRFFDGSQHEMLKRSLRLTLEVTRVRSESKVVVSVIADDVGHRVPTGSPDRNLMLVVEARDENGNSVGPSFGPTLPKWLGDDAGKPGQLFAKVLKDFEGRSPVPFWRASPEFVDSRLTPGRIQRLEFRFPADVQPIARLIYRKSWSGTQPNPSWVVAEVRESDAKTRK
jgi:hypothetical protein